MALQRNTGQRPRDVEIRDEDGELTGYRRVRVVLFGGYDSANAEPGGWASGGRAGCEWRISRKPHPFEIQDWEIV